MQWKKPAEFPHYTDLCKWIDEHITQIYNPGENPDVEGKIYNYLWLVVKALAIKKSMFQNFQDYDPYAFYSANRLFFALRKNMWNQGKTIKGKQIKPIKSCLNYMKALLYPMKIEYQRETFREIIDEDFVSKKWDAQAFKEQMIENVMTTQVNNVQLRRYLDDSFRNCGVILDKVMEKTPFVKTGSDYKKIRISVMLNCLNSLKTKNRMVIDNNTTMILWKLPKSMSSYVRLIAKEFCTALSKEVSDCFASTQLDAETAERIISYQESEADYNEQY